MPAVENVRSLVTVEAVGASRAGSILAVPDEPDSGSGITSSDTLIICSMQATVV